ncbi:MAG: ferrous iron transport protein B [Bacteroidales bacterium]|jgi:ferrous iron transport protein B|nr:ferrous iron transport protein B [Bacteroidales bacterium]
MKLNELAIGEHAVITKITGRGTFRKRIMEMGFVKGKKVCAVKKAPLNDPIEFEIMGYHVSLRAQEAAMVEVVDMKHIAKDSELPENKDLTFEQLVENQIHDHGKTINVALVGNPNCGKTTFYNYASGSKEHVGNYAGVTVDARTAHFEHGGYKFEITDLPGTYSLTAYTTEEIYVRKFITEQHPDVVINMLDSSNLERNLYLTTQLIDMDVKTVCALNMYDELEARGDKLDHITLGHLLGIPFVPVVSSKGKGFGVLFDTIIKAYEDKSPQIRHIHINYGANIEPCIKAVQLAIKGDVHNPLPSPTSTRFLAVKMLEKDKDIIDHINKPAAVQEAERQVKILEDEYKNDSESVIADIRYGFIAGALKETYQQGNVNTRKLSDRIDNILTHKYLGLPIFIIAIWLMFQVTFTVGQYPMDWIDSLVDWIGGLVRDNMPKGMLKDLIVDGIIGGVGGVIVFLPNIVLLFMFISLMEDSGYMARVAFLMDRVMHKIGLHGKSFIPLIMGFGCNVPAVMATRTLENRSDRILTMLINPYMSCSARLPLYTLMTAAFFASNQALVTLSIYLLGIVMAALTAILLRKTSFKRSDAPFVMELPPYRIPTLRSVLKHMWEKAAQYLKKMGGVILIASIIVWALGYFPQYEPAPGTEYTEQEWSSLQQENSYIGRLGHFIEPVIRPLGFDWKMGVSIFTGVAAKEIVVSTMGVLYHSDAEDEENTGNLATKIQQSQPPIDRGTAYAFMAFVLLYFPCIATAVAIRKESSRKWMLFSIGYSLVLAWVVAWVINLVF